MIVPKKITTSAPRSIHTDRFIIDVYERDGIIRFYRTKILLGQIVRVKSSCFTFRAKDFELYKQDFKKVLTYMEMFYDAL